jgi:hypothetical protein
VKATHFTEGPSLSVGTRFTGKVTVCGEGTHFTVGPTLNVGKELTLQSTLISAGKNSLYKGSYCLLELTIQRELLSMEVTLQWEILSVGTHFTEGPNLWKRTLRESYCL